MQSINALHQRGMAAAENFRGNQQQRASCQRVLTIFHGDGKGKTTAAMGMAMRAIFNGMKVGIVQFLGGGPSAEYHFLANHLSCDFKVFGNDVSFEGKDRPEAVDHMNIAWRQAEYMLQDASYRLVILDDINPLIHGNYLSLDAVARRLHERPGSQHVILTGRKASFEMLDMADIVTEMKLMKHPSSTKEWTPQAGVEF